jgi:hypothetical protein
MDERPAGAQRQEHQQKTLGLLGWTRVDRLAAQEKRSKSRVSRTTGGLTTQA